MTTGAALLAAVLDSPEDDLPRLVYADWLEERGRPERAEFIRVQCELAGLGPKDTRRPALEARERDLLRRHEATWVGPLRGWARSWAFRRGFVEAVHLKAETFLKQADALFGSHPIRHVELHRIGKLGGDVAACPHLPRLASLAVRSGYALDVLHLIRTEGLAGLTRLDLEGNHVGLAGAQALAAASHLAGLTELNLACCGISYPAPRVLAESPTFRGLRVLDLRRNGIGLGGMRALAASPHLAGLRLLRVPAYRWELEDEGERLLRARFGDRVQFER